MAYRTLETLRGIVAARLGFAGQGASVGAVAANIKTSLLFFLNDYFAAMNFGL